MELILESEKTIVGEFEAMAEKLALAKKSIAEIIIGQDEVIEQTLITLLCNGHGLLVGLPGLAKTKLVETIAATISLASNRIQFTPDLMPSDILGSEVLHEDEKNNRHFRFLKGPIFTQLLMADEINRASPRTQSALLQAMQEYHITIAAKRHDLASPFHVLATQNPIEQEGTYPLPEAQLDRFIMQIDIGYPNSQSEKKILQQTVFANEPKPKATMSAQDLTNAQHLVRQMPVGEKITDAIISLVRNLRPTSENSSENTNNENAKHLSWGPGPRGSQALILAVRARALLQGRFSPSLDDVVALAEPVLKHRMTLDFTARAEGLTASSIIEIEKNKLK